MWAGLVVRGRGGRVSKVGINVGIWSPLITSTQKYVKLLEIRTATKDAIKVTLVTAFLPFLFADDVVLASEDTLL